MTTDQEQLCSSSGSSSSLNVSAIIEQCVDSDLSQISQPASIHDLDAEVSRLLDFHSSGSESNDESSHTIPHKSNEMSGHVYYGHVLKNRATNKIMSVRTRGSSIGTSTPPIKDVASTLNHSSVPETVEEPADGLPLQKKSEYDYKPILVRGGASKAITPTPITTPSGLGEHDGNAIHSVMPLPLVGNGVKSLAIHHVLSGQSSKPSSVESLQGTPSASSSQLFYDSDVCVPKPLAEELEEANRQEELNNQLSHPNHLLALRESCDSSSSEFHSSKNDSEQESFESGDEQLSEEIDFELREEESSPQSISEEDERHLPHGLLAILTSASKEKHEVIRGGSEVDLDPELKRLSVTETDKTVLQLPSPKEVIEKEEYPPHMKVLHSEHEWATNQLPVKSHQGPTLHQSAQRFTSNEVLPSALQPLEPTHHSTQNTEVKQVKPTVIQDDKPEENKEQMRSVQISHGRGGRVHKATVSSQQGKDAYPDQAIQREPSGLHISKTRNNLPQSVQNGRGEIWCIVCPPIPMLTLESQRREFPRREPKGNYENVHTDSEESVISTNSEAHSPVSDNQSTFSSIITQINAPGKLLDLTLADSEERAVETRMDKVSSPATSAGESTTSSVDMQLHISALQQPTTAAVVPCLPLKGILKKTRRGMSSTPTDSDSTTAIPLESDISSLDAASGKIHTASNAMKQSKLIVSSAPPVLAKAECHSDSPTHQVLDSSRSSDYSISTNRNDDRDLALTGESSSKSHPNPPSDDHNSLSQSMNVLSISQTDGQATSAASDDEADLRNEDDMLALSSSALHFQLSSSPKSPNHSVDKHPQPHKARAIVLPNTDSSTVHKVDLEEPDGIPNTSIITQDHVLLPPNQLTGEASMQSNGDQLSVNISRPMQDRLHVDQVTQTDSEEPLPSNDDGRNTTSILQQKDVTPLHNKVLHISCILKLNIMLVYTYAGYGTGIETAENGENICSGKRGTLGHYHATKSTPCFTQQE